MRSPIELLQACRARIARLLLEPFPVTDASPEGETPRSSNDEAGDDRKLSAEDREQILLRTMCCM